MADKFGRNCRVYLSLSKGGSYVFSNFDWLTQGVASNAVYGLLALGVGTLVAYLRKNRSTWASPIVYGLAGSTLTLTVLISNGFWQMSPFIAVVISIAGLLVAAFFIYLSGKVDSRLGIKSPDSDQKDASTRLIELRDDLDVITRDRDTTKLNLENCWTEHKKALKQLDECSSHLNHWKKEVDRVQLSFDGQKATIENAWKDSESRVSNLEQKLRVAQDKLDEFKSPRLRLKIKRAEYHMLGKVGLDVTHVLDQMVLDERLVLNVPYDEIFRPDPQPHVWKHLTIEFFHGIREFSVTVPQNAEITLPFPYQLKETA